MIELVEQTIDQQIDGISIYFKLSEEEQKYEEDTAKAKLIMNCRRKHMKRSFQNEYREDFMNFITSNKKLIKQKKKVTLKINLEWYVCYKFYT